uniref:Uncharacterized protein n=1 Tax=Anguilla anguilla TaxID=7936 RepID=A0A0E9UB27_ANGAN
MCAFIPSPLQRAPCLLASTPALPGTMQI